MAAFENGEEHPLHKLTEIEVRTIRALARDGAMSQRQIARLYNVTQPVVSDIVNRKLWGWLHDVERAE